MESLSVIEKEDVGEVSQTDVQLQQSPQVTGHGLNDKVMKRCSSM